MNRESSMQLTGAGLATAPDSRLKQVGIVLVGSAFVALCAHITLPLSFTPVPLTLQPFAVLLLGMLLSPGLAAATLGAYLLEGAAGLPVFTAAGASFGFAHLLGPTGGYLLSYPLAAYVIARLWRSGNHSMFRAIVSAASGNLVILSVGALWLSILTHAFVHNVLSVAVFPFLPGDALKVVVAAAIGFQWYRIRPASRKANPTV